VDSVIDSAIDIVAGDERSPVLLHVPHAGTRVPAWARGHLLLDDAELAAEIAALTDHRTMTAIVRGTAAATSRSFALATFS